MAAFLMLDKLTEIANSFRLQDKMKVVFSQACSAAESFIKLMRFLCSGLRLSHNKHHRLIVDLEALGQRGDALRSLDYMRKMVVYYSATLGVLEQLLASSQIRMRLKAGYVADIDEAKSAEYYKLAEAVDYSHVQDRMIMWFTQACGVDESFAGLLRDLCFSLRITLSKNRGLIEELEELGARADAVRALGNMREIVARNVATLGVLEQLLAGMHVAMRLKDGYVA
ncbi:hypothetical protein Tco_0385955 [Tanacetum coccineum]